MTTDMLLLKVATPAQIAWDDEADVVICGFGGAGAVAAIEARDHDASVIVIDRFEGGGSTAYSGGVMYAGGTRYQRESGFDDTPDEMFKYLQAEGSHLKSTTLRKFCEDSNANLEWMESFGVPHGSNAFTEKTSFPPDGHWLYYSGNEKMPVMAAEARPAPRGHRVVTPGAGGHVRYAKLSQAAIDRGITVIRHSPVTRLVMDATGTIIGVEVNALPAELWEEHQRIYRTIDPWRPFNSARSERGAQKAVALENSVHRLKYYRARKGVVLSTGGFIQNRELISKYRPVLGDNFAQLLRLGSMGDNGSGIGLGEAAGGVPAHMDSLLVARTVAPPTNFVHGMLVNSEGRRFVNEAAYSAAVGRAILEQPAGGKAWLVLTAQDLRSGIYKSFFPGKGNFMIWGAPALLNIFLGGTRRASSIEGLARKIDVDVAGLKATLTEYNRLASSKAKDPVGKALDLVMPMNSGPFYAVKMSVDNKVSPLIALTMGGLDVNEETGAVIRSDGSDIPGLFAAGRAAVGACSTCFASGLAIADVVFSGRRAGRSVAGATQ